MAGIAIDAGVSLSVAIQTPLHVISIDHLDWPLFASRQAMADSTIHATLNMDPVGKDDEFRHLIHPLPGDRSSGLDISDHFQGLGPFAQGIGGVAGPAEVDIGDPSHPVLLHIAMAEGAIEVGLLFMDGMVEEDGLFDRGVGKDREESEEHPLCLDLKAVVDDNGEKEDQDEGDGDSDLFSHAQVDSADLHDPVQVQEHHDREYI